MQPISSLIALQQVPCLKIYWLYFRTVGYWIPLWAHRPIDLNPRGSATPPPPAAGTKVAKIFGDLWVCLERHHFWVKTTVATFWTAFGLIWGTFIFNIWSHWTLHIMSFYFHTLASSDKSPPAFQLQIRAFIYSEPLFISRYDGNKTTHWEKKNLIRLNSKGKICQINHVERATCTEFRFLLMGPSPSSFSFVFGLFKQTILF